jgi:hypothetical protein
MQNKLYLSSLESTKFSDVREISVLEVWKFNTSKSCILVNVSPAIPGNKYDKSDDLDQLILTSRHEGEDILSITKYPYFVFICKLKTPHKSSANIIGKDELEILAWGELYRTEYDAENKIFDK